MNIQGELDTTFVDTALVKKKFLTLDSKETETINNTGIYDTYKDLCLREKEREEKLPQGMQSANGLKS